MRLKPGRPDLARYADLFDLPVAAAGAPRVTFLGVATLVLDDGTSAVMTDGFFSRPGLPRLVVGKIAPDRDRIVAGLRLGGVDRLDAIVPVHSHFDHILDTAVVAELTGAVMAAGDSGLHVARGHGLPQEQTHHLDEGAPTTFGAWTLTPFAGHHCPPDRYPGDITGPITPPARVTDYRCGETWSLHIAHDSGRTAAVIGSAGFVPGALDGVSADVIYLGVGQLGLMDETYMTDFWTETVRAVGAKTVVLIHWDDFFRPLDKPLRTLPYAGDDLDVTMRVLHRLADEDGASLHLPRLNAREDPWA